MGEANTHITQTFVPAEELLEQIRPFLTSIIEDAIERHFAKDETPLPDQTVAERIGKSPTTLWRWKKKGKIGSVLVGGEKRVRVCDLQEYLEKNGE